MKRNKFSLSNYRLQTMDMGQLIPLGWYEALPGDTIQQATSALIRCSPLLSPPMHPVRVRIHHWFVPLRLIWDDFEDFITGGEDGEQEPSFPTVGITDASWEEFAKGSLADYLGVPPPEQAPGVNTNISALPFRAYQIIYDEYYRDQNLIDKIDAPTYSGGPATEGDRLRMTNIRERAWEKDYFTSSLPWTQRGGESAVPITFEYKDQATYTPS